MGVGLGDSNGCVVKEFIAERKIAEAHTVARLAVGFRLDRIGDAQERIRRLRRGVDGEQGDGEGVALRDDVVFDSVFDEELQADGRHV